MLHGDPYAVRPESSQWSAYIAVFAGGAGERVHLTVWADNVHTATETAASLNPPGVFLTGVIEWQAWYNAVQECYEVAERSKMSPAEWTRPAQAYVTRVEDVQVGGGGRGGPREG